MHAHAQEVAPGVRLVRAPNPSPMTAEGTNTYIVGRGRVAIIDPGPPIARHGDAILAALDPGEGVDAILVTHAHLDHSALAPDLAARTGAPVLAFGPATAGRSPVMTALAGTGQMGSEGVDADFRPTRRLSDGEIIRIGDVVLTAIHTPGHMSNHLCFALGDSVFSGDLAMGWSTSLIDPPDGDLAAYMASLARLAAKRPRTLFPGHGAIVPDAVARLDWLAAHRRTREGQILTALAAGPTDIQTLTATIYPDLARQLLPAAARNVFAHLIDLAERNVVVCHGTLQFDRVFSLA